MNAIALFAFRLRRERILLPVWIVGIAGLLLASAAAITREFGGDDERTAVVALATGNPAFLFLRGLPDGSEVGALVFFQTFAFLAVLTGLMNTFLLTRHTRADEERGRSELLRSAPIGRTATLATALLVALVADVALGLLVTAAGVAVGLAFGSAALTGAALAAVGLAFAGLAALAAQIMPSPRGANGLAAALVGGAYLVRGVGDALGTARDLTHVDASWVSLLSPIGWAQATRPFSSADPLPLLVPLAVAVVGATVALVVHARRDLGSSLVPERSGRPFARHAGPTALAVRSQVGATVGWLVATVVIGALAGVLTPFVVEAVGANDELAALIARLAPGLTVDSGDAFTVALLGIAGTLATAAGVQAVLRLRQEEAEGRAELVLAARQGRTGWFVRHVAVALASTIVVAVGGGAAAGLGFVAAGGGLDRLGVSLAAILVHVPAGAVFIALTALAVGAAPRWAIAAGWGLLVAGLVVGQLGGLLGLPEWVQDLSPLHHVPAVPLEAVDPWSLLAWGSGAVAVVIVAVAAFRQRDLPA